MFSSICGCATNEWIEWMYEAEAEADADVDGVFHGRSFFPTLVRFPQIFMLYINLENYLAHQNKKCYAWCFYIHLAYCSNNNNNNNNKEERRNRHKFFLLLIQSHAGKKARKRACEWVSLCVCSNIYLINADYFCFVIRITHRKKREEPEHVCMRVWCIEIW